MAKYSLRRISASEFVKRLRLAEPQSSGERPQEGKRYAFFLGAGCSRTSGIPMAGGLVRNSDAETDWLRRYYDLTAPHEEDDTLEKWAKRTLRTWNGDSPASSYGELIELLFLTPGERQREIERLCNGRVPNFGYTVLSGLMCRVGGHFSVVLTTNFDDLLAEAFFRFQSERLMVINHDSLAPFIRSTQTRPLLVKLHGDHRLAPRNTGRETEKLDNFVAERVTTVLHDRGLVFVGYGGNDESILRMLEALPEETLPFGVYWVSINEPRGIFRRWLEQRDAVWVEHQDFDELMLLMKQEFDLKDPTDEQFKMAIAQYRETQERLLGTPSEKGPDESAINQARSWMLAANAESVAQVDSNLAESMYQEAIRISPDHASILGSYAYFLTSVRQKHDEAEKYFKRALAADPKHSGNLGAYAFFLGNVQKKRRDAERYYRLSVELNPKNTNSLGNLAQLLFEDGRHEEGMKCLLQALNVIRPTDKPALSVELLFYGYVHGPVADRSAYLVRLKKLLVQGARSEKWDFSRNVERATKVDKHPARNWVAKLAAVCNGSAEIATLDKWRAWRDAV